MFAFVSIPDPTGGANPSKLRVFNISPSGDWICGTYVVGGNGYWWIGEANGVDVADPWTFTRGTGPAGKSGSAKAINDNGDIAGFSGSIDPSTAMVKLRQQNAPVDFILDAADPAGSTKIHGIDNALNVVGVTQLKSGNALYPGYPTKKDIGFKTTVKSPMSTSDPQIIVDRWSAIQPAALTVRCISPRGDLAGDVVWNGKFEGFVLLNEGTANEIYVNVAIHPFFQNLQQLTEVKVSGINSSRHFVGWYTSAGIQHGFVGKVDDSGQIVFLTDVTHSGEVMPDRNPPDGTQLFGISESGRIIGTFNNIAPFLCVPVPPPESPISPDHR